MGIVRLWPAFLAVLIPVIVLLYLLKQKVKNQKIPALNLWREAYENIQASTPWEKFRNNILMYLQIAALILLIIALMSPYIAGSGSEYSNILIMIDNSASMSGMYSESFTKLETAKKQAIDYVSSNDGVRYTVISAGSAPNLVVSSSDDKGRVADAINGIEATDVAGSLNVGINMAQSVVEVWESYKVLAFTDSSVNMQNIGGEVIDLSVKGDNASIQNLSHTVSDNGTVKVMARVDYYGQNKLNTDVNLYIGDKLYDIQSVTVEPKGNSVVYFKDIPRGKFNSALASDTPYFMAELNSKDILANDNTAYDIINGEKDEKILLVTDKNTFLEKALKLSGKTVDKVTLKDIEAAKTDEYSLVVYDGILPEKLPKGNVIFIDPPETYESGDTAWQQEVFQGQSKKKGKASTIKAVKCDITEYIEDYSFSCLDVSSFDTPSWAFSFFNTNGKLSTGYTGNYNGKIISVVGFDLHNTDFPLQTEFPVFMYNLLNKTMSARIMPKTVYDAGEMANIQKKADAKEAVVTKPDGSKETYSLESGMAVFSDTLNAGLYYIEEGDEGMYFTVSFPEDESDVSEEAVVTSDKNTTTEVNKKAGGSISKKMIVMPLLALLLILLMTEWYIYKKRL